MKSTLTVNPYDTPSPLPDDPTPVPVRSRPLGIAILAVLHAIGGLLFAGLLVFLFTQFGGGPTDSIIGLMVVVLGPPMTILALATPVGLWRGHNWAWWLATLYYFQFVVGGVLVLATIPIANLLFDRPFTERSVELVVKHAFRLPLFSFLTWYMTKRNVLVYFEFKRLTRIRALAICGGLMLLFGILLGLVLLIPLSLGVRFG